jgi:hypothetical protein
MAEPTAGLDQWLTVSEAASRLGWHPDRVKSALRRGRFQARKNNAGKWMVLVPPAMPERANGSAGSRPDDTAYDPAADPVTRPADDPAVIEAMLAAARAEGALTELRGTVAELRQALEHERARGDRLEAALAEARRPWLAKVLEGLRRKG